MRSQRLRLVFCEAKHEILRKTSLITRHLLIQLSGRDAVQFCQVEVDHDLLPANQVDSALDELDGCRYTTSCEVFLVRHGDRITEEVKESGK